MTLRYENEHMLKISFYSGGKHFIELMRRVQEALFRRIQRTDTFIDKNIEMNM